MSFNPASIVSDIVSSTFGDMFQKVVGSFKADPTKALELQAQLAQAEQALKAKLVDQISQQIAVDQAEAESKSTFVAGWRPFIGWVCGSAIAIEYIIGPLANWAFVLAGKKDLVFPSININALWPLITGMLGFGGFRTYEKVKAAPGTAGLK